MGEALSIFSFQAETCTGIIQKASISEIASELGWEPTADRDGALRATVRWYVENREWWERILRGEYRLERLGLRGPDAL